MESKICSKCHQKKNINEFHRCLSKGSGYSSWCKECKKDEYYDKCRCGRWKKRESNKCQYCYRDRGRNEENYICQNCGESIKTSRSKICLNCARKIYTFKRKHNPQTWICPKCGQRKKRRTANLCYNCFLKSRYKLISNIEHKKCSSCNEFKPVEQFHKATNGTKHNIHSHCKDCVSKLTRDLIRDLDSRYVKCLINLSLKSISLNVIPDRLIEIKRNLLQVKRLNNPNNNSKLKEMQP